MCTALAHAANPFAEEGFFTLSGREAIPWPVDLDLVARGVANLVAAGLPPSFIAHYDEVWLMQLAVAEVMGPSSGGCVPNMDVLAWCVDPSRGDAGFTPHRDRQPDDARDSFRGGQPEGRPRYATCWVALADAHPESSCLYMLPRKYDPGYADGDHGSVDPLTVAMSTGKNAFQNIRALPLPRGGSVFFTSRVIHWGSRGRAGQRFGPRYSVAFPFSDPAYEEPYFVLPRDKLVPSLALRHALLAGQMVIYHERYDFSATEIAAFHAAFSARASQFAASYVAKVLSEFGAAIGEAGAPSDAGSGTMDDLEDEALEALLDAAAGGAGPRDDFSDDFGDGGNDDDDSDDGSDGDSDDSDDGKKKLKETEKTCKNPSSKADKKRKADTLRRILAGDEDPEESSGSGNAIPRPAWFTSGKKSSSSSKRSKKGAKRR
jgi:hypothetical protein